MMGAFQLMDWDYWDDYPRAMLKITADNQVIYEGEVEDYFGDYDMISPAKAFKYKNSCLTYDRLL